MNVLTRVAVDTSKSVLTRHGVDRLGKIVVQRDLRVCLEPDGEYR